MGYGSGEIRVEGLRELQRGLRGMNRDLGKQLTLELREVAEDVKTLAQEKAVANIPNIGDDWSRMRIGVTTKMVYVAPARRRRGGSPRKNLAGLLVSRAMQPAADEEHGRLVVKTEAMLDRLEFEYGLK